MSALPIHNLDESSGREGDGTFKPGHKLSIGNDGQAAKAVVRKVVTPAIVQEMLEIKIEIARNKDNSAKDRDKAADGVLDRGVGKPAQDDLADRVTGIEDGLARVLELLEAEGIKR